MAPRSKRKRKTIVRPTRLGLHLIFIAIFTMVGGAIRGFNLLLVLAGLLVGALLISWRYSRWFSRSVDAKRGLPMEVFSQTKFSVSYAVQNFSRWLPAWAIRVEDNIADESGKKTPAVCSVGAVPPKLAQNAIVDCAIEARGEYQFGPLQVSSCFPFSLYLGGARKPRKQTLLVLPRRLDLRGGWQNELLGGFGGTDSSANKMGIADGDFFGLRQWQTGDNTRMIHHRTSARVGEPIVRQVEKQLDFDACVLVDCFTIFGKSQSNELVERAIRFAATLLIEAAAEPGVRLAFAVGGSKPHVFSGNSSPKARLEVLRILARVKASNSPQLTGALKPISLTSAAKLRLIVISPRSQAEAIAGSADQAADGDLAATLGLWGERQINWIDVSTQSFKRWMVDAGAATEGNASDSEPAALVAHAEQFDGQ